MRIHLKLSPRWLFVLPVLIGVAAAIAVDHAGQPTSHPAAPAISPVCLAPMVRVVIDYPDGTQVHYPRVQLNPEHMTVLDAMTAAAAIESPRSLKFEQKGSGATALIKGIGGFINGTTKDSKAWQYWINDEYAKVGAGAAVVKPTDRITWAYLPYTPEPPKRPE